MIAETLRALGIDELNAGVSSGLIGSGQQDPSATCHGAPIESENPSTGQCLARVLTGNRQDYERVVELAREGFQRWRTLPAPERGLIVREIGQQLRKYKEPLGKLVSLEVGKIHSEGLGEVQEMIDMCDLATGMSRQLYGLTIASERPEHRMFEQWHPLGPVGVITAFNFPVAVWAWNAMVAAVCGDTVIWKPSPMAPLTAIAVQKIVDGVMQQHKLPKIFHLCITQGADGGRWMAEDRRLPLISATGSCEMGRSVGQTVAGRLGRSLLELGGNNGIIVTPSANLDLALRAIVFAAAGTTGQRCTTLRRLFLHESIADDFLKKLVASYQSIPVGKPWEHGVLMGPLISAAAVEQMMAAVDEARQAGGAVLCGGQRVRGEGYFVQPTIIEIDRQAPIVACETFAPILYAIRYQDLDAAIAMHNSVDQGLSSAIFSDNLIEAETFLSPRGSDCGIANVNIGTSGAEIGGAFGGEKDTGGGREAGSDSWKAYMRRQTCTVNYGRSLPLAQGVSFDI